MSYKKRIAIVQQGYAFEVVGFVFVADTFRTMYDTTSDVFTKD